MVEATWAVDACDCVGVRKDILISVDQTRRILGVGVHGLIVVDTPYFLVSVRCPEDVDRGIHEGRRLRETAGDGEACGCGIIEGAQEVRNASRSWHRMHNGANG